MMASTCERLGSDGVERSTEAEWREDLERGLESTHLGHRKPVLKPRGADQHVFSEKSKRDKMSNARRKPHYVPQRFQARSAEHGSFHQGMWKAVWPLTEEVWPPGQEGHWALKVPTLRYGHWHLRRSLNSWILGLILYLYLDDWIVETISVTLPTSRLWR